LRGIGSHKVPGSRYDELIEAEITHMSIKEPRPLTLKKILSHKIPESLAPFLCEEVAVRYATRIKVLEETVPDWCAVRELAVVRKLYAESFKELRHADPEDSKTLREVILGIRKRHVDVVRLIVAGMSQLRKKKAMEVTDIDRFLNTFVASRIGTEILTTHYLMMTDPSARDSDGIISVHFDPEKVINGVVQKATMLANRVLRKAPKVIVNFGAEPVRLVFVQQYFSYILFELLKNSFRATVEKHSGEQELPPVEIQVSCDENMVGVKISDQGGGIPMANLESVWSYTFTTAHKPLPGIVSGGDTSPLAGFGCGLPLSLQYATYLGGGLDIVSIPGIGTNAYLVMNKPGDAAELVPSRMSLTHRSSGRPESGMAYPFGDAGESYGPGGGGLVHRTFDQYTQGRPVWPLQSGSTAWPAHPTTTTDDGRRTVPL
jgi:pyruvate dehydrogenase kinase 2/3/4